MRTFIEILTDVLAEAETIPEIRDGELTAIGATGRVVTENVERKLFKKIARLQTLYRREQERSEMPPDKELRELAESTGHSSIDVEANALGVQRDGVARGVMIERIIVEFVRDEFPQEAERFDQIYWINEKSHLVAVTQPQRGLD